MGPGRRLWARRGAPPLRMRGNASWKVVQILEDKEKIIKRCCYYSRLTLKFSIFLCHSYTPARAPAAWAQSPVRPRNPINHYGAAAQRCL